MKRDRAALSFVRHLHLNAENVAELPFQRRQIGICYLGFTGGGLASRPVARSELFASSAFFRLPNG